MATYDGDAEAVRILHVDYAEQRINYGIIFIFSPSSEYSHLEYEHVPV